MLTSKMWIIDTLLLALITGITSSSMAAKDDSGPDKGLLVSMLDLSSSEDSINSNTFHEKVRLVEERLKEACDKNGRPDVFYAAKKGWESLLKCKEPEINDIQSLTPEESFIMAFKKQCAILPATINCMKQFKESVEPCLAPNERDGIKLMQAFMDLGLQFICAEDGARVAKFVADGGVNCMRFKERDLQTCSNEFTRYYNSADSSRGKLAAPEMNLLRVISDTRNCANIEKFQRCIVKVLEECEHHTPADIVNALFDSFDKEIHCENYRSEASSSALSGINTILITIVIAIFLCLE